MSLSPLQPDERAFVEFARACDWPHAGMLCLIIERICNRLETVESELSEARAACADRMHAGKSLAETIIDIRCVH